MEKEKFRISLIDFIPHHKKVEIGKYADGSPACLGDVVKYNNESNWLIAYRYGKILLKQVGMWAMIGNRDFENGDFSCVEKTNRVISGADWLIIGYTDESMHQTIKKLEL